MTIRGLDLASHQGPNFPFKKAADQGFSFVIIKGAGGHSYQNEYRAPQVAGARAAGLIVGFYHYMYEPTSGGGDVDREAANFIAAVRPYWQPGDSLWLDVEEFAKAVGYTGDLGDWIVRWCDLIEAEFGIVPGIYCATWYLVPTGLANDQRLARYPFWMASWQDALPAKSAMRPWDRVTLWQYNATYTGLTGAHLDCNEFQGSREELIALGTPKAAPVIEQKTDLGLTRADGFMEEIEVHFKNPTDPGKGIPYKVTVWAYNPDEGRHYSDTWEMGEYQPWIALDPK